MTTIRKSNITYWILIGVLTILSGVSVWFQQQLLPGDVSLPASKPVLALANMAIILIVYGGLGYVGLTLTRRMGWADIWEDAVSNRQRFVIPAIAGIAIGLLFIPADMLFSRLHDFGPLPHPGFPLSLIASATAGIGEEIIFRLFFITFWVWLISWVLLRKRYPETIFWIVAVWSALVFATGHIPSFMAIMGLQSMAEIPVAILLEIFLLNSVLSLPAAWMLRRYGFLAAVGIHFWTDIVWHVVYGALA